MSDQDDPILRQAEQSRLKQQLAWRLGIAAALIVIVLAAIWFLDHVQQNNDTPQLINTPHISAIASAVAEQASVPASAPASAVIASVTETVASEAATASAAAAQPTPTAVPTPAVPVTTQGGNAATRTTTTPSHYTAITTSAPVVTGATTQAPSKVTPAPAVTNTKPVAAPPAPAAEKIIAEQPATVLAPGKFEVHAGANGYTVQAGVFLHASNADKLLTQLQNAGVPAWLETRVQIGPFKNKADAEAAISKLRKLGIEPVVRENQ
ncbi:MULTISPECIES: SPOR domain-containing protein [Silvimonas]|uniref:SPOR domain-containing protein n=1 Tax=Silvimonas TaxID=300264 RepID=UPI0024B355AD|nr:MULTISPECIES: SPOR domain-containing protein [Silvimonas]MDR3428558.1 SPOR domain-containing protein [Silvimonas sp.]